MSWSGFLEDYGASLAAFSLFALLHSVGAQEPGKRFLARWSSQFFVDHFWRLIYCTLSFWALYEVIAQLHWVQNPAHNLWLWDYPDSLWTLLTLLHLISVLIFYIAFIQSDYLEFLGFKQAWRGIRKLAGRPPTDTLQRFGTERLTTDGVYAWVRHPMLSAGLLFLLTSGPSLNNLIYTGMYTAYMLIGGYYEERRLLRIFGEEYRAYQRQVGAFAPRWRRFRQAFS